MRLVPCALGFSGISYERREKTAYISAHRWCVAPTLAQGRHFRRLLEGPASAELPGADPESMVRDFGSHPMMHRIQDALYKQLQREPA